MPDDGDFEIIVCAVNIVLFDCNLTMADEISRITNKARAKVTAILRSRNYYNAKKNCAAIQTHVLCLLESSSRSICHAAPSHLGKLDKMQKRSFWIILVLTRHERLSDTTLHLYNSGETLV